MMLDRLHQIAVSIDDDIGDHSYYSLHLTSFCFRIPEMILVGTPNNKGCEWKFSEVDTSSSKKEKTKDKPISYSSQKSSILKPRPQQPSPIIVLYVPENKTSNDKSNQCYSKSSGETNTSTLFTSHSNPRKSSKIESTYVMNTAKHKKNIQAKKVTRNKKNQAKTYKNISKGSTSVQSMPCHANVVTSTSVQLLNNMTTSNVQTTNTNISTTHEQNPFGKLADSSGRLDSISIPRCMVDGSDSCTKETHLVRRQVNSVNIQTVNSVISSVKNIDTTSTQAITQTDTNVTKRQTAEMQTNTDNPILSLTNNSFSYMDQDNYMNTGTLTDITFDNQELPSFNSAFNAGTQTSSFNLTDYSSQTNDLSIDQELTNMETQTTMNDMMEQILNDMQTQTNDLPDLGLVSTNQTQTIPLTNNPLTNVETQTLFTEDGNVTHMETQTLDNVLGLCQNLTNSHTQTKLFQDFQV